MSSLVKETTFPNEIGNEQRSSQMTVKTIKFGTDTITLTTATTKRLPKIVIKSGKKEFVLTPATSKPIADFVKNINKFYGPKRTHSCKYDFICNDENYDCFIVRMNTNQKTASFTVYDYNPELRALRAEARAAGFKLNESAYLKSVATKRIDVTKVVCM